MTSLLLYRRRREDNVYITSQPIVPSRFLDVKPDRVSGGRAVFLGYVRENNDGKKVAKLFYECYQALAEKRIERIIDEARKRWNLEDARVIHRIGWLDINDIACAIYADAMHRKAAFEACEWILEEVKRDVPSWKKERYEDSSAVWLENHNGPGKDPLNERDYLSRR